MTNPKYTLIAVVLDRSGSMHRVRDATIEGLNAFITSQQQTPGCADMTLVQFDDQYEVNYECRPIEEVSPLTHETYMPRGMTALLDAIGRTIDSTGKKLAAMPENERPGKVIFVVQTDGDENCSHEYTRERVFDMIKHQREVYNWEFMFLGANQDAIASATSLGMLPSSGLNYNHDPVSSAKAFRTAGLYSTVSRSASSKDAAVAVAAVSVAVVDSNVSVDDFEAMTQAVANNTGDSK